MLGELGQDWSSCSAVMTSGPRRAYFSGNMRSSAQAAARQYCSLFAALRIFLTSPSSALPLASREFLGELRVACGLAADGRRRAADVLGRHALAAPDAEDGQDAPLLLVVEDPSAAFGHEMSPVVRGSH